MRLFRRFIDYVRSGYPDGAPATGYLPLVALNPSTHGPR